jgi:hypothetical protein
VHRSETIEERLASTKGRTTGFDYLRATLSISVIAFHSFVTSYGGTDMQDAWDSW